MTETPRSYFSSEPDTKYSGELKDGMKHGHGTLIFRLGTAYE